MLGSFSILKLSSDMPNLPNTVLPKSLSLPASRYNFVILDYYALQSMHDADIQTVLELHIVCHLCFLCSHNC